MTSLIVLISGLAFALAVYLSMQIGAAVCEKIVPFDDGPRPGTPPVKSLIGAAFVVGMLLASKGVSVPGLGAALLIFAFLAGAWYCDVRCGIVPDYFTLIPLALVVAFNLYHHVYLVLLAVVVPTLPFAFAAWKSKGLGMGWGDVKLAAFGGALLGINMAVLAFAGACMIAVGVSFARGRRKEPIAFAPYLAAVIALAFIAIAVVPQSA